MTGKSNSKPGGGVCRQAAWNDLRRKAGSFDIIVIGGGITGAGIVREAARRGLRALLVEQRDFAWGTSSRSSKMVHGGLRYLGSGQLRLTRDAVRERQRFLREVPGLVDPMHFVMPHYRGKFPGPRVFGGLLWLYDRLAGQHNHEFYPGETVLQWVPGLARSGLVGGTRFADAVTDDARLVLRLLDEARGDGAVTLNYTAAAGLARSGNQITGVNLEDALTGESLVVSADLIVNATGAWTDGLRGQLGHRRAIRPLRGSHLIVPFWRLPVSVAISLFHPEDGRAVFVYPWEGVTIIGTTDLDHPGDLIDEARISEQEVEYLLAIIPQVFPGVRLGREHVQSSWAGVRPVVSDTEPGRSNRKPSREKREHAIWDDQGLISVAGGKLTTFRLIALEVLEKGAPYLRGAHLREKDLRNGLPCAEEPTFTPPGDLPTRPRGLLARQWKRLKGHYGARLAAVLEAGPLEPIAGTDTVWAELAWSAKHESVCHLDDLLLRRTRLGLLLPEGGAALLPRVRALCQEALGWDDERWEAEEVRYRAIWRRSYSLPDSGQDTA